MKKLCAQTLSQSQKVLVEKIAVLKRQKKAIILCHNYQRPEIYEVADFVGDSLELSRKAKETPCRMIVFSGVHFMAESAKILNPGKKVVVPDIAAGCALSDMITADALRKFKAQHPDAAVVCYVNTTAAVKAESDVCCTSSNAVKVVRGMPHRRIIFVPDKNLASFVAKQVPEKEILAWEGYCPIHERLSLSYLQKAKAAHPQAKIIAHPECTEEVRSVADYVVSTSGMMKVAQADSGNEFICTTECGMVQRMKREIPGKKFYTVCSVCFDMKKNTLEKICDSLETEQPEVLIPEDILVRAGRAFDRMFELTDDPIPQISNIYSVEKIKTVQTV